MHNKTVNGAFGWTTLSAASQQSCLLPWRYKRIVMKALLAILLFCTMNACFADGESYLNRCKNVTADTVGADNENKYSCLAYTKGVIEGSMFGSVTLLIEIADSESAKNKIRDIAQENLGSVFNFCLDKKFTVEKLVIQTKDFIQKHPSYLKKNESLSILTVLLNEYSGCE